MPTIRNRSARDRYWGAMRGPENPGQGTEDRTRQSGVAGRRQDITLIEHTSSWDRTAARLADKRMRQWTLGLEVESRNRRQPPASQLREEFHPCLTISRETGSEGAVIARRVGEMLGLEVLHREILDYMARRYGLRRSMLDFVDERTSNWFWESFGKWLDKEVVTQSEYIVQLGRILLLAARHASSVLVGRGAQFLLPREKVLAVYIVSPLEMRAEYVRQSRNCSVAEAKRYIRDTDRERRDFVRTYFHRDMDDPHLYDLVINRAYVGVNPAAEMIANQWRTRFGTA